jgi:hypothetical protein
MNWKVLVTLRFMRNAHFKMLPTCGGVRAARISLRAKISCARTGCTPQLFTTQCPQHIPSNSCSTNNTAYLT